MSPAWCQILTVLAGPPRRLAISVRVGRPASRSRCSRLRSPYSSRMLRMMSRWKGRPSPLVRPRSLRMAAIWAWVWRSRGSSTGGTASGGGGAGLAGGEPDVRGDGVAGAGDGDVGEQQPGDALAFAGRGGGVVPDRGQGGDGLLDTGFLGVGELPGV